MITRRSRYNNAKIDKVVDHKGRFKTAVYRRSPYRWEFEFKNYTIKAGDRLDLLAHRFYNDPLFWWVLVDANPELESPYFLTPGTNLRVPDDAEFM